MILAIIERTEDVVQEAPFNHRHFLTDHFIDLFDKFGILLFPIVSEKNLQKVESMCDGLIVTGSAMDINPSYYKEKPLPTKNYEVDEYKLDKKVMQVFHKAGKPILGICGGLQVINVFFGGSLNQRIENHYEEGKTHAINIKENSFLFNTYKTKVIKVNSFHYQSVKRLAKGFDVTAYSDDGTIEAIEKGNIIGVQWHPEEMKDMKFFKSFIKVFLGSK